MRFCQDRDGGALLVFLLLHVRCASGVVISLAEPSSRLRSSSSSRPPVSRPWIKNRRRGHVNTAAALAASSSSACSSSTMPSTQLDVGWIIELEREEVSVQEKKDKLVQQLDEYEASLRRLRYDRVDYLVRRQQQQLQQEEGQEGGGARSAVESWIHRASRPSNRRVVGSDVVVGTARLERDSSYWVTDTVQRSLVKALVWRALAEVITYVMALQWFRSAATASRFVLAASMLKLMAMVGWERIFARRRTPPPSSLPIPVRSSAVPRDGVVRSLAKAASWRAMTVAVNSGLLMGAGAAASATSATATELVVGGHGGGPVQLLIQVMKMEAFKAALLFLYERTWNRIDWGKIREDDASGTAQ